ncbi:xanthine dehydrogenase family protein molybdopterin-binding subunit [Ramlibacter henchirensis]|uniref:Xanthine dehydrogenase family protein molybdopterin-binding subunit n=1 Tax=Ramlibacter henchirensis TaxID=204072 RepID=A0A4Z0C836_9BURK|nr:xanthine dehydrogenase family protein molybdopterin-binding subunit [Ramlibacter henchirensis]TFZ07154.1 xanthine dehydrogenase family protein molybdopterin-binding subunit [Ramlibacter henchirensis]
MSGQDVIPVAEGGTGPVKIGDEVDRIDGRAKVTGQARYAAEHVTPDMLFGVVVNAGVARGRILSLNLDEALAVPGVVDVLWHGRRPAIARRDACYRDEDSPPGSPFKPLLGDEVFFSGQPIALVVAQTFEAARYAASLVRASCRTSLHDTHLLENLRDAHEAAGDEGPPGPVGDGDTAFESSPVKVDVQFHNGVEHHNPLEMHASTVLFDADGGLVVYDKTQGPINSRDVICKVFGLKPEQVVVRNPFVGGAFGSGLRPQYQLLLAVMAALHLKQPVRVVLTRQQMFTFGHRPEAWQRVKLGADSDGKLRAIVHEAVEETSRFEDFSERVVDWSGRLYRCGNIRLSHRLVDLDRYTPLDMRAPGATHGSFALEVAMDELAYAVGMDPLALRLKNYAERDPASGRPFSSKQLRACYEQGAERFGWSRRDPRPRSLREGSELVGWGMATGIWEASQQSAQVSATLQPDGRLELCSAASDIGTGTYTALCVVAAEAMGLPLEQVTFRLGDSSLPNAPLEGGSSHLATLGSAVAGVCDELRRKLWSMARTMQGSPFRRSNRSAEVAFADGQMRWRQADGSAAREGDGAVAITELLAWSGGQPVQARFELRPDGKTQGRHASATHSAVFCEVRVDEDFGTVRVTRVVSAVAAGRIVNAKAARSQVIGGVVWGIGQALHEETHTDHRLGRFMNHNLSEYHVAVNADVHDIDVLFVREDDRVVSRIGAKGVGEIGILGVAAAISNAIFHATGRRLRTTPMTPDKVMAPGDGWAAGDSAVGLQQAAMRGAVVAREESDAAADTFMRQH